MQCLIESNNLFTYFSLYRHLSGPSLLCDGSSFDPIALQFSTEKLLTFKLYTNYYLSYKFFVIRFLFFIFYNIKKRAQEKFQYSHAHEKNTHTPMPHGTFYLRDIQNSGGNKEFENCQKVVQASYSWLQPPSSTHPPPPPPPPPA